MNYTWFPEEGDVTICRGNLNVGLNFRLPGNSMRSSETHGLKEFKMVYKVIPNSARGLNLKILGSNRLRKASVGLGIIFLKRIIRNRSDNPRSSRLIELI